MYDVVVVGGGPAGLTAAIYLARARYRVLVVEKDRFGGQITITSEVVNYPGTGPISGAELTERMRRQAEHFGAELMSAEVTSLDMSGPIKKVVTGRGTLECFGVLLATGARPRMVGFEGEAEFRGHGVAYCATCDGEFFTGKPVFVVGGGFAAAEEAVFLTKYASHVTILIRKGDFSCAKTTADEARAHPKITVLTNTEVVRVEGDSVLRSITYRDDETGEETTFAPDGDTLGVFVFAGYAPSTELIRGIADLDDHGYVITDAQQRTTCEGLYAAGDVCIKALRQVVTATSDGALAATELEKHVARMHEETGIVPQPPKKQEPVAASPSEDGAPSGSSGLFTEDMIAQLRAMFDRMETPLTLRLWLDDRPVSAELAAYMDELASLTDKLTVERAPDASGERTPCVRVLRGGEETGMAFHGVPGGHEFTSFALGLYNMSGPGQRIDDGLKARAMAFDRDAHITIMVSLSCTMCPDLVTSAQRIASLNPRITTDVYDLAHFPDLKDQYDVMSVPCFVIDEGAPQFGKKDVGQLLDILETQA